MSRGSFDFFEGLRSFDLSSLLTVVTYSTGGMVYRKQHHMEVDDRKLRLGSCLLCPKIIRFLKVFPKTPLSETKVFPRFAKGNDSLPLKLPNIISSFEKVFESSSFRLRRGSNIFGLAEI